jgi:hypothetical protein
MLIYEASHNQKAGFVILSGILAILVIGAAMLIYGDPQQCWQHAARWTADFSSVLFLMIFIPHLNHVTTIISQRQRALGFVAAHVIHAGAFVTYHMISVAPDLTTIVFGGFGYLLIALLVLIPPQKAPRLHKFSIWYIWFIFLATFATGLLDPERQVGAFIGTFIFTAAALIRLFLSTKHGTTGDTI